MREPNVAVEREYDMSSTTMAASMVGAAPTGLHPPPAPDPGPADDLEVVEAPEVRTFEAVYEASRDQIARALALSIGDPDLAAEATDEAMARAYERWPMVSRLDRPEGWIYRVAMNWSLSLLRRRRSQHRLYEPGAEAPELPHPELRAALAELDTKHRTVVVCRHLLGWSVADTAAALNIREGTVKSRLHRAHRLLEARLGHLRTEEES